MRRRLLVAGLGVPLTLAAACTGSRPISPSTVEHGMGGGGGIQAKGGPGGKGGSGGTGLVGGSGGSAVAPGNPDAASNVSDDAGAADAVRSCMPSGDVNCTATNSKTGESCTVDCCVSCGFQGMGIKICSCAGGVYVSCPCPRPPNYLGAPAAPYCTTADGTTATIKNTPCTTEWEECIGKDPVTGTTPQGCVCLQNPAAGDLQWYCGSTNRWFALQ